jgi:hypothetical protein
MFLTKNSDVDPKHQPTCELHMTVNSAIGVNGEFAPYGRTTYVWEVGSMEELEAYCVVQSNHNIYYLLSPTWLEQNTRSRLMLSPNGFNTSQLADLMRIWLDSTDIACKYFTSPRNICMFVDSSRKFTTTYIVQLSDSNEAPNNSTIRLLPTNARCPLARGDVA